MDSVTQYSLVSVKTVYQCIFIPCNTSNRQGLLEQTYLEIAYAASSLNIFITAQTGLELAALSSLQHKLFGFQQVIQSKIIKKIKSNKIKCNNKATLAQITQDKQQKTISCQNLCRSVSYIFPNENCLLEKITQKKLPQFGRDHVRSPN